MTDASKPETSDQAPVERSDTFPPGIPFIVGNEGAERFSFYGMRAILKTYLTTLYLSIAGAAVLTGAAAVDAQKAASSKATATYHLFVAGVYATTMIGGLLADRLLGKYPVIMWLSLLYCAGHGVLAIAGRFDTTGNYQIAEYAFYVGLAFIAIGSGGIKPCVSANVGDQFTTKNKHLVSGVFQIFYFIINFGSFFSTLLIPILKSKYGPEWAFGVPGVVMGLATIVFWFGRHRFVRISPNPGGRLGLLDTLASTCFFTPIVATIIAVFYASDGYSPPPKEFIEANGAVAYYWEYLQTYLSYLAANSWWYFVLAALLVGVGLVLFVLRQNSKQDTGFLAMLVYGWRHRHERQRGEPISEVVRRRFGDDAADGPMAVLRILLVFSMVSVFWALFDQHGSTWVTQAQQMDLAFSAPDWTWFFATYGTVALSVYGAVWLFSWIANAPLPRKVTWSALGVLAVAGAIAGIADAINGVWVTETLKPEQLSALNPLMVMFIIPLLNVLVYAPLSKVGIAVKPLQKMGVGMFLAAAAFAVAAVLQQRIESAGHGQVHALWQIAQYLVMTTSEVLVSVTGLEFAYTQAPRTMKSTLMGFWLVLVAFGNVLVAFLAPMETILPLSQFFWVFTVLMAAAAVVFAVLAYFYKGKSYLQQSAKS